MILRKTRTADINIIRNFISAKENSKEALKRHLFFYECPSALEEKMGMTGCRKTMLRIVAYQRTVFKLSDIYYPIFRSPVF